MKLIELPSQERLNEVFEYNADTGDLRTKIGRHGRRAGDVVGCRNGAGYMVAGIDNRIYTVHRLIWVMVHGAIPEGLHIDHINRVKDDNRLSNLRVVTASENLRNQRLKSNNTSGVCGVAWLLQTQKWVARIDEDGKHVHLGSFDTLEEATAVRKEAERKFNYHPNHGRELQRTV